MTEGREHVSSSSCNNMTRERDKGVFGGDHDSERRKWRLGTDPCSRLSAGGDVFG